MKKRGLWKEIKPLSGRKPTARVNTVARGEVCVGGAVARTLKSYRRRERMEDRISRDSARPFVASSFDEDD